MKQKYPLIVFVDDAYWKVYDSSGGLVGIFFSFSDALMAYMDIEEEKKYE